MFFDPNDILYKNIKSGKKLKGYKFSKAFKKIKKKQIAISIITSEEKEKIYNLNKIPVDYFYKNEDGYAVYVNFDNAVVKTSVEFIEGKDNYYIILDVDTK